MKHLPKFPKWFFITGTLLVIIAIGIIIAVSYFNSKQRATPIVFSKNAMLLETYNAYKKGTIEPSSGRTIDKTQNDLTTSEGQSYTMLRSVWMDDKPTFDKSWDFTRNNLQRTDHLFSWKYGKLTNGKYGILTDQGGNNTASDADQDIALALLMAYSRWNDSEYLAAAKPIITNIWNKEVVVINSKPVLTANDIERNDEQKVLVNPSYFAFANYRIFSSIDKQHDWNGLIDNSYDILAAASKSHLDKAHSVGLPPNWIQIDRQTGAIAPPTAAGLDTNFGYDAMRVPFRLALDYNWFGTARDKQILTSFAFLGNFYTDTKVLNAVYAHDGSVVQNYESPAMYGATFGYFKYAKPELAKQVYDSKLQTLYSPDQQSWKAPAPAYYEDNWAWFGLALQQNSLPNLTKEAK